MKPAIIQLPDIYRGCLYPAIIFKWKDPDGEPFNLTGWVPLCFAKDFNFNVRVTNVTSGEARMVIRKEETVNIGLGQQSWDFIWVSGATIHPPFLSGIVTVREPLSNTVPEEFHVLIDDAPDGPIEPE